MGRDDPRVQPAGRFADVSIHAPAWGATIERRDLRAEWEFQFTRPHGARRRAGAASARPTWFQFTRPHGARPAKTWRWSTTTCFNSRARMGRDPMLVMGGGHIAAFQFTRPHGARRPLRSQQSRCHSFNSRARMGRDTSSHDSNPSLIWFQFTRPHGARP